MWTLLDDELVGEGASPDQTRTAADWGDLPGMTPGEALSLGGGEATDSTGFGRPGGLRFWEKLGLSKPLAEGADCRSQPQALHWCKGKPPRKSREAYRRKGQG